MSDYRKQKKLWKKGRRKATRPFKGLAVLAVVLCVVASIALVVFDYLPMTLDLFTGSSRYTIEGEDEDAVYYASSYDSDEERIEAGDELAEEVEAEGATLLLNEDDTLPLASGSKVTLFSHSSVDLVYGGTGAGGLDTSDMEDLKSALTAVGLEVNETMWDFYETGAGSAYERVAASSVATEDQYYAANEVPLSEYTDTEWESVADYGDAAIVVLSRVGGEGADLDYDTDEAESAGYLGLDDNERDLLAKLKELKDEGTIEKIVVLLNSSNPIQLDFLFDDEYDVDAVLWIGGVGSQGISAVAQILVGEVNPSGALADAFLVDNLSSPSMTNFGSWTYTNAEEAGLDDNNDAYVVYQEGIYVGYLYYETRYEDYVTGSGNAGDWVYSDYVAFAFGSGISYTTFAWSDYAVVYDEVADVYTVQVTVTNTGDVAGKDIVQIYAQSPYTEYDQENNVEKAAVELVGFAKTDELEPGESQTLTIEVEGSELASYDSYSARTYILDAGTYYLTAAEDAHAAVNNVLAAKGYSPANTDGRMDAEGDASMVWSWEEAELDATTYSVSDAGVAITNQFDDADLNRSDYVGDQQITYLSRSDWEGTWPTEAVTLYATDEMVEELAVTRYDAETYDGEYADAEMPTTGADNGLKAADMIDLDYDDELWDDLLDQLTAEDMAYLLGSAFHFTQAIESIDLPGTRDENGPTGITTTLFYTSTDIDVMGLPSEDVMAATWNTELLYEVGVQIGEDCLSVGVTFLYGPGANTHRTAYAGRNFEYFSEDGFLAGMMLAAEVSGLETTGAHVMIKHFALNDQETNRIGICVWANEQSIREIYLKAFQYALEDNELAGVMTSYSRIGCHWAGGDEGLITGILRGEWANGGVAITDNSRTAYYYMSGADMVLAGANVADSMTQIEYKQLLEYVDDPVIVSAMREACHRVIYAIVNSNAMNGITTESEIVVITPGYVRAVQVLRVVALVAAVAFIALEVNRSARYRRANPKPRKRDFVTG